MKKAPDEGLWMSKEICDSPILTPTQQMLLARIISLDDGKTGCDASNAYFAKFSHVSIQAISQHLSTLKKLGLIKQTFFDGRKRVIKVRKDLLRHLRQLQGVKK